MKNNSGVILSTYIYMLLVFFLLVLATMLAVLNNTKLLSNKIKDASIHNEVMTPDDFSIVLLGDSEMYIYKNNGFTDPGYIAKKNNGLNLTATITGTVDTTTIGVYTIKYEVDSDGYKKSVNRKVYVINPIVNMLTNGTFENGTAGWTIQAGGEINTSSLNSYYSSKSLYINDSSTTTATYAYQSLAALPNNTYYYSYKYKCSLIVTGWGVGVQGYIDRNRNINVITSNNVSQKFITASSSFNFTNNSTYSQFRFIFGSETTGTQQCYYDNVMLINLSAVFGTGNEPNKTWCDKHITFSGETIVIN